MIINVNIAEICRKTMNQGTKIWVIVQTMITGKSWVNRYSATAPDLTLSRISRDWHSPVALFILLFLPEAISSG